jgi:hypothetical protein
MIGRNGVLIDDRCAVWEDDSPRLLRRLGRHEFGFDLADYAVRNLGYIHLRPCGTSIVVSLREKTFSRQSLITALYQIAERRAQRIMLSIFSGEEISHRIFTRFGDFTAYADAIAEGEPTNIGRLFAFELDARVLQSRDYMPARPMINHWRACRGRMDEDFFEIFGGKFFQQRATLVRKASPSHFVFEHFGSGVKTMLPCEALRMVGRDISDAPDSEYAAWVAESFAEAAAGERPRIKAVRARINLAGGAAINGSYNRVLLPWRRGTDTMVLGMSILRERSLAS